MDILNNGHLNSAFGRIGNDLNSEGSVTINGGHAKWELLHWLWIGNQGTGNILVENKGYLETGSSLIANSEQGTGTVTVDGNGSRWVNQKIFAGHKGNGVINITNGGVMTTNDYGYIGYYATGTGLINIDGNGSSWLVTNQTQVGRSGTGTLNISNGGVVTSSNRSYVGAFSTATGNVSVEGAGSRWDNNDNLFIGYEGSGSLEITNGGTVNNLFGILSYNSGASSNVLVDGLGSSWNNSSGLYIGYSGEGSVNLSNQAIINVTGDLILAESSGSEGTLNIGTGSAAGIINADSVLGKLGTATLNFNHNDSDYFFTDNGTSSGNAVVITGTTSVNHIASGSTTLKGINTYTGNTMLSAGTLSINGSITNSSITVNSGAALAGSGSVADVTVDGGILAPGNSIGMLTVAGDVSFTSASHYEVEVNASGASDFINVSGTATLGNAAVRVLAESGSYAASTDYTILTAASGVSGTFGSVSSNFAFLSATLSYDAFNVYLNLTRNSVSMESIAQTPNQQATAAALTEIAALIPTIFAEITGLSAPDARLAFDNLSAAQYSHSQQSIQHVNSQFRQILIGRAQRASLIFADQSSLDSIKDIQLAYNGNDLASLFPQEPNKNYGFWLQAFGQRAEINKTDWMGVTNSQTKGLVMGIDTLLHNAVVGVAASYAVSDIDLDSTALKMDSYQAAIYAHWLLPSYDISASAALGYHETDAIRDIDVGNISRQTQADFHGSSFVASLELGKPLSFVQDMTLTPYAVIDYSHITQSKFAESGASTANLIVDSTRVDSLRSTLGLRLSRVFSSEDDMNITPYSSIAYIHEHLDNVSQFKAAFSVSPKKSFNIEGAKLSHGHTQFALGINGQLNESTSISASYLGEFSSTDSNQSVTATFRMDW